MKKVVLLAGALAAGMAAAPVTANAAPTLPDVQQINADYTQQDVENFYTAQHSHIDTGAVVVDDKKTAVNADTELDPYVKAQEVAALDALLTKYSDARLALEAAYEAYNLSSKDQTAIDAFFGAVKDIADTYPTTDDLDEIDQNFDDFEADVELWDEYHKWFEGTSDYPPNDPNDTGMRDRGHKLWISDNYKDVNEIDDVKAAWNTYAKTINDPSTGFPAVLGAKPTIGTDNKSTNDVTAKKTAIETAQTAVTEALTGENGVEKLVELYHTDQNTLLNSTDEGVASLANSLADYAEVDPATGTGFVTDDSKHSAYYETQINNKQTEIAYKKADLEDYIKSFDAADAAAWESGKTGEGQGFTSHDGTTPIAAITSEAAYKSAVETMLGELDTLVDEWETLVQDAKDNVTAYNALIAAEKDRQDEMDALRNAQTTTVADVAISYWEKHRENTYTGGFGGQDKTEVREATGAGTYLYQTFIQNLQKGLNNVNSDYDLNLTADKTDIHDQIIEHFNAPVVDGGVLQDAEVYQTQMTDAEGVIFGELKGQISTLKGQIADNESANKTLHAYYDAKIEAHVNDMFNTCVGYDDINASMFNTFAGRYYSNGTCEDDRIYLGYRNLWRSTTAGDASVRNFINAEVAAYNSFDPADDTKGAKAWLNSTEANGAPAMKQAVDNMIELLWNHVATDQLEAYLEDVDTEMKAKFADAKALDNVCRDAADVWSWTVPADDANECKCEENDTKENPCGWCEATAKAALKAIREAYNTKKGEMDGAHKGDDTAAETTYADASTLFPKVGTAKGQIAAFKTYKEDATKTDGTIAAWYDDFKTADEAHDKKLKDLKDEADQYVHEYIHEAVGNMSHDLANFEEGDLAAADLWAENLKNRTFPVYSSMGGEPTNEALDLDLDGTPDTFAGFEAYVDAVRDADAIYTAKIDELFKAHKWTELRKIADKAKDVHPATDYMKAVEANRTAKAALLAKVEDVRSDVAEAKNEAACEDPACKDDIANMFTTLEQQITNAETAVNNAFKAGDATAAKTDVDALAPAFGLVKKQIDDLNAKVRASKTAATDMNQVVVKAFDKTNGAKILEAQVEGYENFKVRSTAPDAITNTEVKYFDEIETMVKALKDMIAKDDSHEGGHVAATSTAKYLEEMSKIQKELDKLVQAIKDNEQAHKAQIEHRNELYKKYECYDTTGLEAAVNGIADPDFSLDTEFPVLPGYPETTAVDPAGKDHTKAHTAVAEAIKALDDEIKKHYENGASNVEAAKTEIGKKETAYTTAFTHAQTNDSKFMEEYGKCTEAAKAVKYTYENWKADHFANGANKYSDEANVQVTKAYNEMVAAQKAYLADIKTDWYKNEAVENVANNEGLLNTYKEKISAYNAAVEKAQKNDQEFDKQLAAHVVKPLTAEATYTDTRVVADPVYVTLKTQLTALYPECNNVETDSKYNTIRKQIIQDWEDEKSALNGTAEAVAAYQAAANKYNELMANLNAYGSQLVKYLQQKDAFDAAKTTIAGYDIMKPGYKDFDGNTEGAQDYNHKKDIEKAIEKISGNLDTLYGDMKTEANHVAETINDTNPANNEVNDLNVAPAVGTLKTLIENLVKDAKNYEDACDANEAAFEPLHDNIKTVEADYAEGSAKVTALPEPAQEAFNIAVKEDLEALAELQKDLEEAYMDEDAVNFTKDNTDYEDLKEEIEDMYNRAVQAGANLGDIDGVDGITVYDSDALVDIVLYNRGYAVKGDFDFNGENDVTDVERLNNLLWYEHILKAWAPGRVAFEGDIELTAEGNTVALALNNNVKTNGIQFDITVPEGAYIENVLGTDRVEGMRVLSACIADNTYRVLVISTLNASTINDNEGAIVTFNVCGAEEVEVSNVIATDGNSHRLNGAAVSVGTVTGIDEIASEGETDIFTLDGIRQGVMKAGVNIVRGANGVAKKIFNK